MIKNKQSQIQGRYLEARCLIDRRLVFDWPSEMRIFPLQPESLRDNTHSYKINSFILENILKNFYNGYDFYFNCREPCYNAKDRISSF